MNSTGPNDEHLHEAAEWVIKLSCSAPSEEDVRAWSQWCESHPDSIETFESLEALWRAAKAFPPSVRAVRALLAFDREANEANRSSTEQQRKLWQRPHFTRIIIACASLAAGVIAVAILSVLGPFGGHANRHESVSSALAQQRVVVLKDGSRVNLAGRSAVEVEYSQKERLLALLDGEAYFQDTHDASWPFVVTAANVEVVATGTAFDVEKDRDQVAISVVEGTVNVSVRSDNAGAPALPEAQKPPARTDRAVFELKAGEKLTASASGLVHFYLIDEDSAIAWREGRLEFADASLSDVVDAINRYASRPLVITDPSIASERFTGTVFLSSIDEWIDSLPAVFGVTVDRSRPNIISLRR